MPITTLTGGSQLFIGRLAQNDQSRSLLANLALGRLLGYSADIPGGKVEDIEGVFRTLVQLPLVKFLDTVNELVPIRQDAIIESAKKFYLFRYYSAYPDLHILPNTTSGVSAFFRLTKFFSPEELEAINTNSVELAQLTLDFINLRADILKGEGGYVA